MGYQESYVTTKNPALFDDLVHRIQALGKSYYRSWGAVPVEIITLKEAINGDCEYMCQPTLLYHFDSGTRFVYFAGDRSIQRNIYDVLNAEAENVLAFNTELYFTECFPSEDIFSENSQLASHEEWIWR